MPLDPDQARIPFDTATLRTLNLALAFVTFGVALSLRVGDFRRVIRFPRAVAAGLTAQLLLLPALTAALAWVVRPHPALALGMVLVAACPGGAVSNFMSQLAHADTALSVTLTAFSTALAALLTPLNFAFWAHRVPGAGELFAAVDMDVFAIGRSVVFVLLLPLAAGLLVAEKVPRAARFLREPARVGSFLFLMGFVALATVRYFDAFKVYLAAMGWLVVLHNGLALGLGWTVARLARLGERQRRCLALETGLQNAGLGLVIVFNHFDVHGGGMALVAAWYGVWHILAGLVLSGWWNRRPPDPVSAPSSPGGSRNSRRRRFSA